MRTNSMLGIVCASLSLVCAAHASGPEDGAGPGSSSELEDQAYDVGWDNAADFCEDLKLEQRLDASLRFSSVVKKFKKNCKQGFDDYINGNRSCQKRLERAEDGYTHMWDARDDACE